MPGTVHVLGGKPGTEPAPGLLSTGRHTVCRFTWSRAPSYVHLQYLHCFYQVGEELGICGLVKKGQEETKTDQTTEAPFIKCETGGQPKDLESVKTKNYEPEESTKTLKATKEDHKNPINGAPSMETIKADVKVGLSFTEMVSPQSRKFPCTKCKIQFPNMATLKRHPCNKSEKCFECDQCPFKFQLESLLQQHTEAKHMGRPEPPQPKRRKQRSDAFVFQGPPVAPDRRAFNKHHQSQ